jgi:hypothetical protein
MASRSWAWFSGLEPLKVAPETLKISTERLNVLAKRAVLAYDSYIV